MAIDGSFSMESALERFLARCPNLGALPHFVSLARKGNKVTEEVVNSLAELYLHPHYTVPLVGCLRPIAQKIVDRAVALLCLVPDLRSNSDDQVEESGHLGDAEVVDVIQFRVKSGRGNTSAWLACLPGLLSCA